MGRYRVLKNSLLGGQISKDAVGRNDLPQYAHACELLENMIPLLSGGAYRRPGSQFVSYIPASNTTSNTFLGSAVTNLSQSSPPRLIPFIVDNQEAYVLAIGTMRQSHSQGSGGSYHGGGYLAVFNNLSQPTEAEYFYGVLPYRCKSSAVAQTDTNEVMYTRQGGGSIGAGQSVTPAANSGVTLGDVTIVDVVDSLQTWDDDVWAVQYCQSADVMFLTHPDYPPQVIYVSDGGLEAAQFDDGVIDLPLAQSRPYLNQNTTGITMKVTFTDETLPVATLTASGDYFSPLHGPRIGCLDNGYTGSDGAFFALAVGEGNDMSGNNTDNGILFVQVTSVTSSTVCNVTVVNGVPSNYSSGTTTTSWWESAWSNYRGWPKCCAIYQQRLCMASTIHQPNALWFTATTAYGAPEGLQSFSKFSALGDGPDQNVTKGATGALANGQNYSTPANWVYYPVDDSQGNGQSTGPLGLQPFRISLATTTLDAIQYLSPDQQLFLATYNQEWIVAPINGSFDVANSQCTVQSHYGSDLVQAIRIGYELIFVLQNQREIRAYQYNYFDQSFFGEPVQLFFDEYPEDEENQFSFIYQNYNLGRKKFRQLDWDPSRSTLWAVDTAGNLLGMTRDRKLAITSWHTHQFGGFNASHGVGQNITDQLANGNYYTDSANFLCDGSVISACTIPNATGIRSLWVVIKRSYGTGNETIWSIEQIQGANTVRQSAYSAISPVTPLEPYQTDCSWLISNPLAQSADPSNYEFTIGKQMQGQNLIGTYYSQAWGLFAIGLQSTVSSGGVATIQSNLPPDYGQISEDHAIAIGYPYSSIVQPVRIDPPSPIGTSQGAIKRNSKAYLKLYKTLMLKMGYPPMNGNPAALETVFFQPSTEMAQSPEIFTGTREVFLPTNFDRDGYVYILQDQPLPFTLVAFSLEGQEYEQ